MSMFLSFQVTSQRVAGQTAMRVPPRECSLPVGLLSFLLPAMFFRSGVAQPTITAITADTTVREGDNLLLMCTAEDARVAPEVKWTSPLGELMKVSPNADQTKWRTQAVWYMAKIKAHQSGRYRCDASAGDDEGTTTEWTLVTVVSRNATLTGIPAEAVTRTLLIATTDSVTSREIDNSTTRHSARRSSDVHIAVGVSIAACAVVAIVAFAVAVFLVVRRRRSSMAYRLTKHNDSSTSA